MWYKLAKVLTICLWFLSYRLETQVHFCTTGFWEWHFLELQPAWRTSMDQICMENKCPAAHCDKKFQLLFFMKLTSKLLPPPFLSSKLYSQCRGCPGRVGGAGGGWFIQCSHTVQRPQRPERQRGRSDTKRASSLWEEDCYSSGSDFHQSARG